MSLAWLCQKARGQNLHPCVSIMQTGKPDWWEDSLNFLKQDEILSEIVEKYPDGNLESRGRLFETTIRSIVGQQISVIAADAIWARLVDKIGDITPENVLALPMEEVAKCGLSGQKTDYIFGLANNSEDLLGQDWDNMTDTEIIKHLTKFRGIGPWTAEMMLMFSFMRPDVFSIGDIGLIKAVKLLVPTAQTKEDVLKISHRWSPYRTAASWYLWRMLDPIPVGY